jgi:hypothetical protein
MQVKNGDDTCLEAPAKVEPADSVVTSDYYTQLPQIRLTGDPTGRAMQPGTPIEVTLDGNDVSRLVECAIRHPAVNMRYAVLAAIWSHPDSFRQIFRFGLEAPPGLPEIRKIVAEELDKRSVMPESSGSNRVRRAGETLLPRMPLPAHLRDRERK